jgi:hypothetical protein
LLQSDHVRSPFAAFYMNVCSCVHVIMQKSFCQGVLQSFLRSSQNHQKKPQKTPKQKKICRKKRPNRCICAKSVVF